jgi:biopolymer transport protein ExbD
MARKKKKNRVGITMDMTPMVDIGFLLLTFFMLTTQFRPPEIPEAQVIIPTSHSDIKLPESDVIILTINKEGGVFISLDSQRLRNALLTPKIKEEWDEIDPSIKAQYADPETMAKLVPSYPIRINDLPEMLVNARMRNPKLRTVIKGDRDADYGPALDIMEILQKVNISRFNLLTDLEFDKGE